MTAEVGEPAAPSVTKVDGLGAIRCSGVFTLGKPLLSLNAAGKRSQLSSKISLNKPQSILGFLKNSNAGKVQSQRFIDFDIRQELSNIQLFDKLVLKSSEKTAVV